MKNWVNALVLCVLLALAPQAKAADCFKTCVTSPDGIALIQFFEGFSPFIYKDVGGLDTVGYGHLVIKGEKIVQPLLGDDAINLLRFDLARTERGLNAKLKVTTAQHQFDALSSFAFNVGVRQCTTSTLFRYVNLGKPDAAAAQFARWIYVRGNPSKGLKIRRAAEQKKFSHH